MSRSQVNIFIIFITFHLENFNANVALMMKMWGIATSNQGGRGLASFVGTIYRLVPLVNNCQKKPFVLNFFFNLCEQQNIHIDLLVLFWL